MTGKRDFPTLRRFMGTEGLRDCVTNIVQERTRIFGAAIDHAKPATPDRFHSGLQCSPLSIAYDFTNGIGQLFMRPFECCDMRGAINFFRAIDPEVGLILTFSGRERDTRYKKFSDGRWNSETPGGAWGNRIDIDDAGK